MTNTIPQVTIFYYWHATLFFDQLYYRVRSDFAAEFGNIPMAQLLLDHEVVLHGSGAIVHAGEQGETETVNFCWRMVLMSMRWE